MDQLILYSNPTIVFKLAKKYFGDDVNINISSRKNKKYMIYNPNTDKWVHFGQIGYEDYTKHKDQMRRHRFQMRNHTWADKPPYSPSWLSYHLLW